MASRLHLLARTTARAAPRLFRHHVGVCTKQPAIPQRWVEQPRPALLSAYQFGRMCSSEIGSARVARQDSVDLRDPPEDIPFQVKGLNHIAMVVPDLAAAAEHYRCTLGAQVTEPVDQPEHGVTVVFAHVNSTTIELLHPLGGGESESPVAAFLRRNPRGGIHHLCFTVDSLKKAVDHVTSRDVNVLGSRGPAFKIGAHGNPVAFLDPKTNLGVLMEFEEGQQHAQRAPDLNPPDYVPPPPGAAAAALRRQGPSSSTYGGAPGVNPSDARLLSFSGAVAVAAAVWKGGRPVACLSRRHSGMAAAAVGKAQGRVERGGGGLGCQLASAQALGSISGRAISIDSKEATP
eukprot:jgi/Mesen1/2113/ME000151S01376